MNKEYREKHKEKVLEQKKKYYQENKERIKENNKLYRENNKELIKQKYPKDTLDIIVFGDDAWQIEVKDLPYLKVGQFHTNTVAGLELAMELLRRRKNPNKQIFMITDGKPTCLKIGHKYYKNSFGIDSKILNRTLTLAGQLRKLKIPVITFMIADDPYLQSFVRNFTEVNGGKAFYSSLDGLGNYIFEDYEKNKRKTVR